LAGLSPSLQPHSSLAAASAARSALGGLPSVNYGHALHNSAMSQYLDSIGSLPASFSAPNPYKTVAQSPFPFDPPGARSSSSSVEQSSLYGLARYSVAATPPHESSRYSASTPTSSKMAAALYPTQDTHLTKDVLSVAGYTPMMTSQHASSVETAAAKGWGLSNFVPAPSNPFGNLSSDLSGGSPGDYGLGASPSLAHSQVRSGTEGGGG
jgi:hypothetical protein